MDLVEGNRALDTSNTIVLKEGTLGGCLIDSLGIGRAKRAFSHSLPLTRPRLAYRPRPTPEPTLPNSPPHRHQQKQSCLSPPNSSYIHRNSSAAMPRRVPPDRAAQNQQTVKNLLKLEANKICADCKRNKRTLFEPSFCWTDSWQSLTSDRLRSAMGVVESRRLHLHSLLGYPSGNGYSYQSRQVCRPRFVDR